INEERPLDVTFSSVNFGYTTTQYFSMGVGPTGLLLGGTQGNGTNIVGFDYNLGKSAHSIEGLESNGSTNDGFDADMSNLDPSIGFGSLPNGQIRKITGIGATLGTSNFDANSLFGDDPEMFSKCYGGSCGTYYTAARLWESFYDPTAKSTVEFEQIVERGDTIPVGTHLI